MPKQLSLTEREVQLLSKAIGHARTHAESRLELKTVSAADVELLNGVQKRFLPIPFQAQPQFVVRNREAKLLENALQLLLHELLPRVPRNPERNDATKAEVREIEMLMHKIDCAPLPEK